MGDVALVFDKLRIITQVVSGGIVNILGGGSLDYFK